MGYDAIPAGHPWQAGGKTWTVRQLSPFALQEILNLLKAAVPDPRLEAKRLIEGMPPDLARHVWDEQMAHAEPWPPTLETEAGKRVICSPDGMACVIYHALRKSHGGFTRDQAAALAEEVDFTEYAELLKLAFPQVERERDDDGVEGRPTAAPAPKRTPEPGPDRSPSEPLTSGPATNSA